MQYYYISTAVVVATSRRTPIALIIIAIMHLSDNGATVMCCSVKVKPYATG